MITSLDNPRVKDAARLRRSRERRRSGLFIAEGPREVERAVAAGLVVREIFHAPALLSEWTIDTPPGSPAAGAHVEQVSERVLSKLSYRAEPEGVVAVVEAPRHELPSEASLLVVAVGIEKPGNLGAMARTADAAGADALLVADAVSDPWNPNAIRASTGAVFTLPVVAANRTEVAQLPHRRIGAVLGAATPHTAVDYSGPTAFLVGSEDSGLSEEWQALAHECVEIPMRGRTADSLNASAAAAVLLFEAVRQRDARTRS